MAESFEEKSQALTESLKKSQENKAKALQPTIKGGEPGNFFADFLESTVSAAGVELFTGGEPTPGAKRFREESPIAGFASEALGFIAPFGIAGGLAKLPKIAKRIDKVTDVIAGVNKSKLISRGAVKAVLPFVPLEATRLAGTAIANPDKLGEVGAEAAFNLAIEASFGGFAGAIKAAGKRTTKAKAAITQETRTAKQVQLRKTKEKLKDPNINPKALSKTKRQANQLASDIRLEVPEITGRKKGKTSPSHVDELLTGKSQPLNRLFKPGLGKKSGILVKKFVASSKDGFKNITERDAAIKLAGLKDKEEFIKFPRMVEATKPSAAKAIERTLIEDAQLKSIDNNIFWGKEKDGLYVIAKKIERGGEVPTEAQVKAFDKSTKPTRLVSKGDKFVIFKTDQPQIFIPDAAEFSKAQENANAFLQEKRRVIDQNNPLDVLDELTFMQNKFPLIEVVKEQAANAGNITKIVDGLARRVLDPDVLAGGGTLAENVKALIRNFLAPTLFKFASNPRANYIFNVIKAGHVRARRIADDMFSGVINEVGKRTGVFKGGKSIKVALKNLTDEDRSDYISMLRIEASVEEATKLFEEGTISSRTLDALTEIDKIDQYLLTQTQNTQKAVGVTEFQALKGHYLLPRTWEGSLRIELRNEGGELIYLASGRNKKSAQDLAEKIKKEFEAQGQQVKVGEARFADTQDDLNLASNIRIGSSDYKSAAEAHNKIISEKLGPRSFKERKGVKGFKSEFTREELETRMKEHLDQRMSYIAEISGQDEFASDLMKVADDDIKMFNDLQRSLDAMAGKTGKFNEGVNKVVDSVFGDVLGKNSASLITSKLNKSLYHLQLGFGNLAFPVLDATTFIQTVIPEAAFIMSATSDRIARHYTFFPAQGADGLVKGGVGELNIYKLMKNSLFEMKRPDESLKKLRARAMGEGVIAARFVDDIVGEGSKVENRFQEALNSDQPFSNFVGELSTFLPAESEKLSRGHAFATGHILGRDFMKLEEGSEELYQFAKQFTERTMFNYGTADRARVMTGALGGAFGLFKNWQAHYIANMLEYAGEGFKRGNFKPLLYQMGGTFSLGGVRATPVLGLAEGTSRLFTDESLLENLYSSFDGVDSEQRLGGLSDAVYFGLPAFGGLSMSGQTSAPGADPSRDMSMMMSFVVADRANALGKAVGSAIDSWSTTGNHPINSQEVRDKFIMALAPKSVARTVSVWNDRGVRNLNTSNLSITGLNTAERIMVASGFLTLRQARQLEANQEAWSDKELMNKKISGFGRAWAEAQLAKDYGELTDLRKKIITEGLDVSRVVNSAMNRIKNKTEDRTSERLDKDAIAKFQRLGLIPR